MSSQLPTPYVHLKSVLTASDIEFLINACKTHLSQEGMPCYVLINDLATPTFTKIKDYVERCMSEPVFYLNDFYLYTERARKTSWHMDTELFTFDRAVNAWVLLSPDVVRNPLGFIDRINDVKERRFHSIRCQKDQYQFGNYRTGEALSRPQHVIEAEQIHTPTIQVGDILLIDPGRFHKTNADVPKHSIAIKFVLGSNSGFLSPAQVDSCLWPEVEVFNKLVKGSTSWEHVISGIRLALKSEAGRKELSAGFYPEHFDLYRRMASSL